MQNLSLANPHDLNNPPSKLPLRVQQLGVVVLVVGLVLSVIFALTEHWRRATFGLGISMLWVAVLRLLCDSHVIALIAVRSRRFDVFFSTLLGASMVWLSISIDALGS
ncbi:DUF3017 domain-containing protein [Corynebacterium lubricantis]|uniref:DUF3017 domain-containing protein n=1 Tax=Corynebacterium lubricantis TaxID=541095 RepID=UPI000379C663|nr:DUF3017 domain-containing protein [Corynebacterium lubricantis]